MPKRARTHHTPHLAHSTRLDILDNSSPRLLNHHPVNERRLNEETNEWENGEPVFHRVVVFNRLAHNIAASVHKGDTVLVNGDLRFNNYTDQDGNAREGREIVASSVGPSLRFATATVVSNSPKVNSPAASATGPVATPEATGADIAR